MRDVSFVEIIRHRTLATNELHTWEFVYWVDGESMKSAVGSVVGLVSGPAYGINTGLDAQSSSETIRR